MEKDFNIKDLLEKGDELRERPADYIQIAKNTLESYPLSLEHGIQKDAIQNGWDACIKKTQNYVKNNWKFEFELIERPDLKMLIMSDFGTHGLSGKMTAKDVTEDENPPEEERWARWESLAFGKGDEENLGARGQGKMIFIAASKDHAIFYDSLRGDGSYRMGVTQATHKGCPILHYDGDDGRKKIEECLGLKAIDHQGTRVIIRNPEEEVIESIKNRDLLRFVEETWWPIIIKFGAEINIKYEGNILRANPPDFFPITKKTEETKTFKIWCKEDKDEIEFKFEKSQYKIKRACFACDLEKDAPEIHRGVAVFRGNMKVDIVKFPNKILRDKVYGYVEFEPDLDIALRKIELPNHYGFRDIGIWRKIERIIEEELEMFGNKKLGLGIDIREREKIRRSAAENKAVSIMRAVTKSWPFSKRNRGGGGGDEDGDGGTIKEIGLRMSNLNFPNPGNAPRLNYGESLDGFYAKVFNKTEKKLQVNLKAFVLSGDRVVLDLDDRSFLLKPTPGMSDINKYSFKATKKIFPSAGEYKIRFSLRNAETKKTVDEITRRFWIEMDPKLSGPFEIRGLPFSELQKPEIEKSEWQLYPEGDKKYTLYYNIDHPTYHYNDENEYRLTNYLSEIFCMGALQMLVKQAEDGEIEDKEKMKNLPFDVDRLLSDDPKIIYAELTKAIGVIRFDINNLI